MCTFKTKNTTTPNIMYNSINHINNSLFVQARVVNVVYLMISKLHYILLLFLEKRRDFLVLHKQVIFKTNIWILGKNNFEHLDLCCR